MMLKIDTDWLTNSGLESLYWVLWDQPERMNPERKACEQQLRAVMQKRLPHGWGAAA
jgi:hypothetical protein